MRRVRANPSGVGSLLSRAAQAGLVLVALAMWYVSTHLMAVMLIGIVLALIAALLWVLRSSIRAKHIEHNNQIIAEVRKEPMKFISVPGMVIGGDEFCVYKFDDVQAVPAQATRVGDGVGVMVPFLFLRAFMGHHWSHNKNEYRPEARCGTLYATTRRLIFIGDTCNYVIPYAKMITLLKLNDGDGIRVETPNGKPIKFLTRDSRMSASIERLLLQND